MDTITQVLLTLGGIILTGAFSTIGAVINANSRQKVTEEKLENAIENLKNEQGEIKAGLTDVNKRLNDLNETDNCCALLQKDVINIKRENRITMKAIMACLDGLQQLGANHSVPKAKSEIDTWLNDTAHE